MKTFKIHRDNGFHLTFPNGNGLSTVWGPGTYNDNFNAEFVTPRKELESNTVEVMPYCSETVKELLDAKFPEATNGGVFGYLTFEQWLEMVNILATHPNEK